MKLENHQKVVSQATTRVELLHAAIQMGLPAHMANSICNYVYNCTPVGSFLQAIIFNDLCEACGRADDTNVRHLYNYVKLFHNYVPRIAWGSKERYTAWLARIDEE